mmetsp:Transcript_28373/g.51555  ORF Transcript_28373/g.51555 Transcript_28373/m.51555 type:complete len:237 (-) Transcript_28373:2-712(-)
MKRLSASFTSSKFEAAKLAASKKLASFHASNIGLNTLSMSASSPTNHWIPSNKSDRPSKAPSRFRASTKPSAKSEMNDFTASTTSPQESEMLQNISCRPLRTLMIFSSRLPSDSTSRIICTQASKFSLVNNVIASAARSTGLNNGSSGSILSLMAKMTSAALSMTPQQFPAERAPLANSSLIFSALPTRSSMPPISSSRPDAVSMKPPRSVSGISTPEIESGTSMPVACSKKDAMI